MPISFDQRRARLDQRARYMRDYLHTHEDARVANRARARRWAYDNSDWLRFRMNLHALGLTLDQYHSRLESQNFMCAICHEREPHIIDYDRQLNIIRGLVCRTCGAGLRRHWTSEQRERLKDVRKNQVTPEVRQRLRESHLGKIASAETRAKQSLAMKRAWAENPKPMSDMTRLKMSVAKRGKPWTSAQRAAAPPILQVCAAGHQIAVKGRTKNRSCRQCRQDRKKAWATNKMAHTKGYERKRALKRCHGMSLEDYDRMLAAQDGKCATCDKPEAQSRWARLYVDHNHATGQIRGLLCHRGNFALGQPDESPVVLRRLADYLETHLYNVAASRAEPVLQLTA